MDTTPPPLPLPQPGSTFAPVPLAYGSEPAGQCALYSPQAVGLATFLGAPVAGTVIMALNYRRLGRPGSAMKALAAGVLATAALMGIGFVLPGHSSGILLAIIPLAIMVQLAKSLQGDVFARHKLAGGKVASMWKAAGVGALSMVVILAVVFALAFTYIFAKSAASGTHLKVGISEVIYSGNATGADAAALGKALTDNGYFDQDKARSVLLSKDSSGTTVSFVTSEEAAERPIVLIGFTNIIESIAPAIGGKPITLKLVNPELKELKSKTVE